MNNRQLKLCSHYSGYFKEIVDESGDIDLICAKCGRFDDPKYEERVEKGKLRYERFNEKYRKINRDRSAMFRMLMRVQKSNERRKHV